MRNVDKLLRKAKTLLDRVVEVLFSDNEDGFLDCLGVDPEKYVHVYADGSFGYDFLSAIADTAAEDWADGDDYIGSTNFPEEIQEYAPDEETEIPEEPWKRPWWNSLARSEKEEILLELGIPEESMGDFMEYIKEQPKEKKGKSCNLFGWG